MQTILSRAEMERAWSARDADYDGLFFIAVKTTGIFCRPSCPSQPKRQNVEFFQKAGQAVAAGYRPCKRCRPELVTGAPPPWIAGVMERVLAEPGLRIKAADLRAMGISPERIRRWFQAHYGMTFAAWCRGIRLSQAFTQIRSGKPLDDVILGNGFESHSGFREAFARAFDRPPGRSRQGRCLVAELLETPLGPMLAAASDEGICLLEFADRRGLEASYAGMRTRFALPVVPGRNEKLEQLETELQEYFSGRRTAFDVPVVLRGTPFQEKVWRTLQELPFGKTVSYHEMARRIGRPTAHRAVARANGTNRVCVLVPCHRVIAKDGKLSGYGGGVWRKQALLDHEREVLGKTASSRRRAA